MVRPTFFAPTREHHRDLAAWAGVYNTSTRVPSSTRTHSMTSRFVVGIDLGTTNCALAYVDAGAGGDPKVQPFLIPQVVNPGEVDARPLLPSNLYLPGPGEQPAGAMKLPWDAERDYAVG